MQGWSQHDSQVRVIFSMAISVTLCFSWDNRADYVKLLREKRIEELASKERISAVKCGLATIIPLEVLSVFSEEDLDLRVCGIPEVDLDYLKVDTYMTNDRSYCTITGMYVLYTDTYNVSSWSNGD